MESSVINRTYCFDNLVVAVGVDPNGSRTVTLGDNEQPYREIHLTKDEAFALGAALYDEFMVFDVETALDESPLN